MNLKKWDSYLRVNLLGPGPRLMEKKNLPAWCLTKVERNTDVDSDTLAGYVTSIFHFQERTSHEYLFHREPPRYPPNQWQLRTIDITFVLHDGKAQYWKHACFLYVWNWNLKKKEEIVFDSLYCFSSQTSTGKKETNFCEHTQKMFL